MWVRKKRVDPLFTESSNGRVTVFDKEEAMRSYLYRDDSLDKASKLRTFKLESLKKLAENNEKLRKEQEEIKRKRDMVKKYVVG